ncbi:uncharacterized protein LOC135476267 isoform X3 [Liolophura sinensis]|uniref:uncharacterized protein LOC135476267 isoform X3 n=1 Tax=Liolophura sinensis TaxID=3198878 RepID=UPI0031581604
MFRAQPYFIRVVLTSTVFLGLVETLELSMTTIYVKAMAGSQVDIPCGCNTPAIDKDGRVIWKKGQPGPLIISRGRPNGKVKVGEDWQNARVSINGSTLTLPHLQFPRDHGEFVCFRKDPWNVMVTVLDPPKVNVTYDNTTRTLTCTADGGPLAVQFRDWKQELDGKIVSTHPGRIQGQTTELHLSSLTYQDTGYYVCTAANAIKTAQTAKVYVQPKTKPVFPVDQPTSYSARLTQPLDVSVHYYAHPQPSIVRWDKSRVNGISDRASRQKYRQRQESANVTLSFHGTLVSIQGTAAIFSFRKLKKSDAGSYTLTLGNSGGLSVFRFSVSVTHPRHGSSEEVPVSRLVTYALAGLGAAVLLIVVVVLLSVCGVIPCPGRKSKSRQSYSPPTAKANQDALVDLVRPPKDDTFHGLYVTDSMLKDDVNENHQL